MIGGPFKLLFLLAAIMLAAPPVLAETLPPPLQTLAAARDEYLDDWVFVSALISASDLLAACNRQFGPADPRTVEAYFRTGMVFHRIGRARVAERIYDRALRWMRQRAQPNHELWLEMLERRMVLTKELRMGPEIMADAQPMLNRAMELLDQGSLRRTSIHADLLQSWGNILRRSRRVDEAALRYEEAAEIRRNVSPNGTLALADNLIWLAHLYSSRPDNAELVEQCLDEAQRILVALKRTDHPLQATLLHYRLRRLMSVGDDAASRELIDRLRPFQPRTDQALPPGFGHRLVPVHLQSEAELDLVQGHFDRAFESLAAVAGLIATERTYTGRHVASLVQPSASRELLALEPLPGRHEGVGVDAREVRRIELEAALTGVEHEDGVHRTSDGDSLMLRLQGCLDERTAIVGWVRTKLRDPATWGVVVRNRGSAHWVKIQHPIPRSVVEYRSALEHASQWPTRIDSDPQLNQLEVAIGESYLQPLLDRLEGVDRIVWMPFGETLRLPVESLRLPDGTPLGLAFESVYAPSAEVFVDLMSQPSRYPRSLLVVADPVFSPVDQAGAPELLVDANTIVGPDVLRSVLDGERDFASLPRLASTWLEAEAVAGLFDESTVLRRARATESTLTDMGLGKTLQAFDVIHIATHALFNRLAPSASALALTADRVVGRQAKSAFGDGLLSAREIGLSWSLDADLVTLSGCQTGFQSSLSREAGIGFLAPILEAGARALLMSRWKVHDHATYLFMRRFYENRTGRYRDARQGSVGDPMSKAGALREARSWLRALEADDGTTPYSHPVYWASFFLVGDPR